MPLKNNILKEMLSFNLFNVNNKFIYTNNITFDKNASMRKIII